MRLPLDPVRIRLTYLRGKTEYEPPFSRRPMSRADADWLVANVISSGYYRSRARIAANLPALRVLSSIIVKP